MKLATWNVNSLKVRLPHVVDWLRAEKPRVLVTGAKGEVLALPEVNRRLAALGDIQGSEVHRLPPLFADEADYAAFKERHDAEKVEKGEMLLDPALDATENLLRVRASRDCLVRAWNASIVAWWRTVPNSPIWCRAARTAWREPAACSRLPISQTSKESRSRSTS